MSEKAKNCQVMHHEKYGAKDNIKAIEAEVNREYDDPSAYANKVDLLQSKYNISLIHCDNFEKTVHEKIAEAGFTEKDDSVLLIGTVYSASESFWNKHYDRETHTLDDVGMKYFEDCVKFHNAFYGEVISAEIHLDETNPHLHVYSVPIGYVPTMETYYVEAEMAGNKKIEKKGGKRLYKPDSDDPEAYQQYRKELAEMPCKIKRKRMKTDEKGNVVTHYALAGNKLVGNEYKLSFAQTVFNKEVASAYGLDRGECRINSKEKKKHIKAAERKLEQLNQEIADKKAQLDLIKTEQETARKQLDDSADYLRRARDLFDDLSKDSSDEWHKKYKQARKDDLDKLDKDVQDAQQGDQQSGRGVVQDMEKTPQNGSEGPHRQGVESVSWNDGEYVRKHLLGLDGGDDEQLGG